MFSLGVSCRFMHGLVFLFIISRSLWRWYQQEGDYRTRVRSVLGERDGRFVDDRVLIFIRVKRRERGPLRERVLSHRKGLEIERSLSVHFHARAQSAPGDDDSYSNLLIVVSRSTLWGDSKETAESLIDF